MTDFSESLKITWTGPGSTSLSGTVTRTADGEDGRSTGLTASQANKHLLASIRAAGLKMLYMKSTTGCTVYWNSASDDTPAGHVDLTAGVPLHYLADAGMTNPFGSTNITDFYVTETDAAAGTLDIRWLQDTTP